MFMDIFNEFCIECSFVSPAYTWAMMEKEMEGMFTPGVLSFKITSNLYISPRAYLDLGRVV